MPGIMDVSRVCGIHFPTSNKPVRSCFFLFFLYTDEDEEPDPGIIIIYASNTSIHDVLSCNAVANIPR